VKLAGREKLATILNENTPQVKKLPFLLADLRGGSVSNGGGKGMNKD
jgi:hypothetical protein